MAMHSPRPSRYQHGMFEDLVSLPACFHLMGHGGATRQGEFGALTLFCQKDSAQSDDCRALPQFLYKLQKMKYILYQIICLPPPCAASGPVARAK